MRPALIRLIEFLAEQRLEGAIMKGVAASALGVARFTHDIDATVALADESLGAFFDAARRIGFVPLLEDIRNVVRSQSKLVLARIRAFLQEFASLLENPGIAESFENALREVRAAG